MRRIWFIIKRIFGMDYAGLFRTIGQIHDRTGRSRIWLFFDMVHCGIRYGCGYNDYRLCEFYDLNDAQRATYVTRGVNNTLVHLLNDPADFHYLDNKAEFNRLWAPFVTRDWVDLSTASPAEFSAFVQKHPVFLIKPVDGTGGHGVEKLDRRDYASDRQLYDAIKASGSLLAEEYIIQHPQLSALYPHSVNTYRIVTILTGGVVNVVYAFIRVGNHGAVVDNLHSGGMFAPVDLDTGIITCPAYDKQQNTYEVHPETGARFVGTRLPYWPESVEMCRRAALVMPSIRYIGWDIAVTEKGPQLIEGNPFPGYDILQMPPHTPDKIGMLPRIRRFVPEYH
jgi:glutathione synthase/RimK-type ligase-like ATP-grasp enzyme